MLIETAQNKSLLVTSTSIIILQLVHLHQFVVGIASGGVSYSTQNFLDEN